MEVQPVNLIDFVDLDTLFRLSARELDQAIEDMSSETIEALLKDVSLHRGQGVMK